MNYSSVLQIHLECESTCTWRLEWFQTLNDNSRYIWIRCDIQRDSRLGEINIGNNTGNADLDSVQENALSWAALSVAVQWFLSLTSLRKKSQYKESDCPYQFIFYLQLLSPAVVSISPLACFSWLCFPHLPLIWIVVDTADQSHNIQVATTNQCTMSAVLCLWCPRF